MLRLLTTTVALATLGACTATTAPPPLPLAGQPDCAAATFSDDRFVAPAFTDKLNGRYHSGARHLDVWREGQRLYIGTPGSERRQLQRTSIPGSGDFRDSCGRSYRFILPPDGPGGFLLITDPGSAATEWHRR